MTIPASVSRRGAKRTTYRIGTWDCNRQRWESYATHQTKWQIRTVLRELYAMGYTQISIQVRAETHKRPAARWDRGFVASDKLPKSVRRKLMDKYTEKSTTTERPL